MSSDRKKACANCKRSKVRCINGQEGSVTQLGELVDGKPCERCIKLDLECGWQPAKKTGRPVKRNPSIDIFAAYAKGVPLIDAHGVEETHDLVYYAALSLAGNLSGDDTSANRRMMLELADEAITAQRYDLRCVVGLIYTIHDDYGRNDITAAQHHLSYVCSVALGLGLNTPTPNIDPNDRLSLIYGRIWWEIYLVDVLLNLSTSSQITRQIPASTHIDVDMSAVATETAMQEAYDGRIKAALLLSECTRQSGRLNFERVEALDTMILNLASTTQSRYHNDPGSAAREMNLMSTMMLLASRVHLHRQAWFADMAFNFESCAFGETTSVQEMLQMGCDMFVMPHCNDLDASLSRSLQAIREASDLMLQLIRSDQVEQSQSQLVPCHAPPHWPFYTCCQLVAAYGPVLEIALWNASRDQALQDATPSALSPSSENGIWRTRAALSSIDVSHATLSQYSRVWVVAQKHRDEVALCRNIVDRCGPSGFGGLSGFGGFGL
ncbi:hypothetical protein E3P99_00625 [Wallemia hederae]|uniref:Zn(2)-C6 fungal-type domain-containing protein n=1 Tax=Wallemia hederae TaxID=1540922 RepID=A0A4T0FUF6_9BASI|nr:hypothetical protein E3P99_00625 [Wallemia hederae]